MSQISKLEKLNLSEEVYETSRKVSAISQTTKRGLLSYTVVLLVSLIKLAKTCNEFRELNNFLNPSCSSGTYPDWDTCLCIPCHPYCSQCTGAHLQDCTACMPDNSSPLSTLNYQGQFCHGCSNPSEYRDMDSGTCFRCHSSCLTCTDSGASNCNQCHSGFSNQNGICV